RFAALQAGEELARRRGDDGYRVAPTPVGSPDAQALFLKRIWYRLPLYVRPAIYFFYRYVLRPGFLDGKHGFVFHFLPGFWYRVLVDVKLEELLAVEEGARSAPEPAPGAAQERTVP